MNPNPSSPEKVTPDDPRLTAFALGELSPGEHTALAAAIAADPALAAEVETIRALAADMQATLAAEPAPAVTPSGETNLAGAAAAVAADATPKARAAIVAGKEWRKPDAATTRAAKGKLLRFPAFYWLATAAAACFALVVFVKNPSSPTVTPPHPVPARESTAATLPSPAAATVAEARVDDTQARPELDAPKYQAPVPLTRAVLTNGNELADAAGGARGGGGAAGPGDRTRIEGPATTTAQPVPTQPVAPTLSVAPTSPAALSGTDELTQSTTGPLTVNGANTFTGGVGLGPPGAPVARGGAGRGGRGGGAGGAGVAQGYIGGSPSAPAGRGAGGRAGGQGGGVRFGLSGGGLMVPSPTTVVVNVSHDADVSYRYPLPAPDVIIRRPQPPTPAPRESGGEQYARLRDNPFTDPAREPFSTFSADVDTASYANLRRFLQGQNRLPPPDAVRIEEMVNYFPFSQSASTAPAAGNARSAASAPFTTAIESVQAPWLPSHRLVRVTLKARDVAPAQRGPANLVFLLDVSGSMDAANKLPLVKESMRLLLSRLRPDDRVAIVTYANGSGVALPSTPVERRTVILDAIDSLRAEGGTNGAAGIQLAYQVAQENLNREGINRVILCTDGDFNVGATGSALTQMVVERARGGVFLSVLGFGMGNLNDAQLEQLADRGNGHYGYIDTRAEAQKIFVDQLAGTLVTVAKDVKFQVEFNPARVAAYRLIGYEDRLLAAQDFNNDRVDAGEVGAGHTVTALYEIVPPGADYGYPTTPGTDAPRYTETTVPTRPADAPRPTAGANSPELLTVKVRYKQPASDVSEKLEFPYTDGGARFEQASADLRFAAAVAGFGMTLRESPYRGGTTLTDVITWAEGARGEDPGGLRAEFIELVRRARDLRREPVGQPRPLNAPGVDAPRY
jgi:secreted protein with Ig-like and vWFA domain/anti-sigma factor RsiW